MREGTSGSARGGFRAAPLERRNWNEKELRMSVGYVVLYDGDVNCTDLSSRDGITKYVSGRPSGKRC